MAIEKSTDAHGITHPNAYWKVVQVNLNMPTKTGKITFDCYHSSTEKDIPENVLTQKNYAIESADYNNYFAPSKVNPLNKNQVERAYKFAKDKKEIIKTGYQEIDGKFYLDKDVTRGVANEGASEIEESDAKESFFEGGIDV